MIYLQLFLTFLKVGAFAFGGGYAMLSLIGDSVLAYGWMTEEELLNFAGVETVIPGPIAVNMATFIGSAKGGIFGSLLATLGVVLPSFIIILIIAALIQNLLKYAGVKAFLSGIRPCIVGLILATAITMLLSTVFGFSSVREMASVDVRGLIILGLLFAVAFAVKKIQKKKPSPILMILLSAGLGMIFYSIG